MDRIFRIETQPQITRISLITNHFLPSKAGLPRRSEGFKQGMEEIARGEVIELDEALQDLERPE